MMKELLMLAGSLIGVGLVVMLVHFMSQVNANIDSDLTAAQLAEAIAPDFIAGSILRDKEGQTALIADAAGHGFIILKMMGSHANGRFLPGPSMSAAIIATDVERLVVDSGDRWFGSVTIIADSQAVDAMRRLIAMA